jgi:hypothetical protein
MMLAIPAAWITYGTELHYADNDARQWRIPLWLQMTFSGFIAASVFFLPESPRWLIANGRQEEALEVITKYHGDDNPDSPLVQLTYREMQELISKEGSDKRWWDYSDLVKTRAARWRITMVWSMSFFGQWSGNAAVSYFLPAMLRQAGIDDVHTQLKLNGVVSVISFIGAMIGSTLVDKVGRRKMLFGASCSFVLWFVLLTALSARYNGSGEKHGSNAARTPALNHRKSLTFHRLLR